MQLKDTSITLLQSAVQQNNIVLRPSQMLTYAPLKASSLYKGVVDKEHATKKTGMYNEIVIHSLTNRTA